MVALPVQTAIAPVVRGSPYFAVAAARVNISMLRVFLSPNR